MSHNTGLTAHIGPVLATLGVPVSPFFIYREGAASPPVLNVYGTVAELEIAMALVPGPKIIQFDDSLGQPRIPAGTWSAIVINVEWQGSGALIPVTVDVDDGAVFSVLPRLVTLGLTVNFKTQSVPAFTTLGVLTSTTLDTSAQMVCDASATLEPIFVGSGTSTAFVVLVLSEMGTGPVPLIHVADGGTLALQLSNGAVFHDGAAVGDGAGILTCRLVGAGATYNADTQLGLVPTTTLDSRSDKILVSNLDSRTVAAALQGALACVWQPGGTGPTQTWDDVMAIVASHQGPTTIFVDSSLGPCVIPDGPGPIVYDMNSSYFDRPQPGGPGASLITLTDGAVLHNFRGCRNGAGLMMAPTLAPCLTFSTVGGQPSFLFAELNGAFQNNGTVPAIEIADGSLFVLLALFAGVFLTGTAPMVNLGVGSLLILGSEGGPTFQDDIVSSIDGSSFIIWRQDGTGPSPLSTNAGFSGTTAQDNVGPCASWTTAGRPIGFISPIPTGLNGFNTDLGIPEWWSGTQWVDATGTPT